ncbi:MAG TPA: winged helix-turn-helix domain-containing protein, partial [Rhodanobacteraceae bacterium]|nr:winged helix-turn-helix domain-containing protein [Rhodanobacteraceae bacterium]
MPPTDRYRFGDFVLCPSTRELRRGCERVALPAKSFDCIVYLLLHRARAVGRDELVSAVWGRAEVGETVLNQTILHARRALGETSRAASAIRTVIGFGYHWVAPTEQLPSPAPDATSATGPAVNGRKGLRRHGVAVALALLIAAIGVAAAFRFSTRREAAPAARDLIVVLPVETGAATDAAWLRLGMMDLIASHLRDSGGKVMPSDGVVALARGFDTHDPAELDRFAATVGARLVVQPHATRRGTGWEVELASAGTPRVTSEAAADDPLDAALAATDALAMKLGLAVAERTAHGESSLRTLIQEIKAATLSDRLAEARALVDRATPAERADPELRFRAAKIDAQAGRTGEAETALRALLAETSAERDRILRARILDALGVIALQRSDAAAAETLHGEAIALLDAGKDEGQLGKALANRAAARFTLRRDDAALEDVARARGALEDSGDALSLLFLDANLGAVDMLRDRYRDAAPMLERAATRLEALRVHYAALNDWDAAAASRLLLLEPAAAERIRPRLGELGGRVADPRLRFGASLTSVEILIANGA